MTQIFDDPKSFMFSRYLRCWRPAGSAWPTVWSRRSIRFGTARRAGELAADSSPRRRAAVSSFARCSPPRIRAGRAHVGRARAGVRAAPLGGGPAASPQIVMTRPPRLRGSEEIAFVDRRGLA